MSWDNWGKPWNQEQCEQRYVEGDRISLKELAKVSQAPIQTIRGWCRLTDWVGKRDRFQLDLKSKTQEKLIEKLSEKRSEEIAKLIKEHFKGYNNMRLIASIYFSNIGNKIKNNSDYVLAINAQDCQKWASIFDKGVQGERQAMGMEYIDLNLAIMELEKAGYKVVESTEIEE